jgi:hypothetical protein
MYYEEYEANFIISLDVLCLVTDRKVEAEKLFVIL